jgi:hypothetical protein
MGVKVNVNEMKTETMKYEVMVWHGPGGRQAAQEIGVDVPADKLDYIDAKLMLDQTSSARVNPWEELTRDAFDPCATDDPTFLLDEDDTPGWLRLAASYQGQLDDGRCRCAHAADNASVVCGPNLNLNTDLLA